MDENGVPRQVGRYRVLRQIGSGGMGTVYLGLDELLERRVAIKALHPHRAMDEAARRRFLHEARSLSCLAHPGICTIHDILEQEGTQYLILEYIEGTSLRAAIQDGSLPWEQRLEIAEELLEAVAAAHAAGLVHRDLKPANVMLRAGGGIAVLDFGLARVAEASAPGVPMTSPAVEPAENGPLTEDAVVVGTPGYIPPEQADGISSGPPGDVYTLGLVLQELLTGEPAFDTSRPWYELLAAAKAGERRPVNLRQPALRHLIERMTAMAPEDRPTAEEALTRLRQIRSAPERRRRRRYLVAAVAAAAILSLAAGIGIRRWLLPPPLLTPGEHARIAVLPFAEPSGDTKSELGTGVAAMLSQTLASHPRLDVVPESEVVRFTTPGTDPAEV
ncbi:MAG TPA: serine/threonine protein kinase, partial [Acidobacteria bacterium]|nr:serine/threonine protein kinase [Acidobacteriota bacterium]